MPLSAASHLLTDSALRCIIVQPAYRLNAFGFLASAELQHEAAAGGHAAGNMGFWDQRLALEWTHANVGDFGGNAGNITVGGYSAGSYSTFQQLAHELLLRSHTRLILTELDILTRSNVAQKQRQQFWLGQRRIGRELE